MTDWKEITLRELIESGFVSNLNSKRAPLSSEVRSKMQGQYPYYGAASPIDFVNDYKFDGLFLLVAEDGTVFDGKAPMLQLVNGRFWVSNHSHVLQGKDHQATKLLYYILRNVAVAPYVSGAVQPKLTKENLYNITFSFPESKKEQKAIAGVLGSLDDKIELLREENKTLESTAQAIFKEWFVNFNFPADSASRSDSGKPIAKGNPYQSSGGKMIDSELGKIPEGWRVGAYKDTVDVVTGKGIKKEDLKMHGLYRVLGANGEIGKTDKYLFDEDLILTGRVGTLGTIYISQGKVWISDNVLISKPKFSENFYFSYLYLKEFNFESLNRGSTQPLIAQTDLKNVAIVLPEQKILERWHDLTAGLFKKIFQNNSQIQTLSTLRDTLLPKLMRGEFQK